MTIIDARLRPATDPFLNSCLGLDSKVNPVLNSFCQRFGMPDCGESVAKRDINLCLKEMDEAGITFAVAPSRWGWTDPEPMVPPAETARVVETYPNKFKGVIAASCYQVERALRDTETYCVNGPCDGVNLEPAPGDEPDVAINDKSLYPLYEYMQENNLVLYVTGGGLIGAEPVKMIDAVLRDFPRMYIIDAHAHIPLATEICLIAMRRPNLILCPDLYGVNTFFEHTFVEAAKHNLQDQIVFGTAYPFMPLKGTVDHYMNKWNVSDAVKEKIMYKNIARVMNITL